jgi:hypothetical protein
MRVALLVKLQGSASFWPMWEMPKKNRRNLGELWPKFPCARIRLHHPAGMALHFLSFFLLLFFLILFFFISSCLSSTLSPPLFYA